MKTVKELWKLFEEQERQENPEMLRSLNGPVSATELKKLEAIMPQGARLPTDYMDLLHLHNGSDGDESFDFGGYNFLSINGILQAYRYMKDRSDAYDKQYGEQGPKPKAIHGVQQSFNNPAWIPVLAASDWKNFICIDFDPASGGSKGQIIDIHHRAGPVGKVFRNFTEFFNNLMSYYIEDFGMDEETKQAMVDVRAKFKAEQEEKKKVEVKPPKRSLWSRLFAREGFDVNLESMDEPQHTVTECWKQIIALYEEMDPDALKHMGKPITPQDLQNVEKKIGYKLPASYVGLLKITNGGGDVDFKGWDLEPLQYALHDWEINTELLEGGDFDDHHDRVQPSLGVKKVWWNRKWFPILSYGNGDSLCIDMDPAPHGNAGQIVEFVHDWRSREVIANSFPALMNMVLKYTKDQHAKHMDKLKNPPAAKEPSKKSFLARFLSKESLCQESVDLSVKPTSPSYMKW